MSLDDGLPSLAAALLRLARYQAGISQAELARRAGVSPSTICAYERDRRQPTLPTLLRLLHASGYELGMHLSRGQGNAATPGHRLPWPPAIQEGWLAFERARAEEDQPIVAQRRRAASR